MQPIVGFATLVRDRFGAVVVSKAWTSTKTDPL